jgi:diguanylate cyclase (GGDEF)-like protein
MCVSLAPRADAIHRGTPLRPHLSQGKEVDVENPNRSRTATAPTNGEALSGRLPHWTGTPEANVALLLRLQRILEPEALFDALVVELKNIVPAARVSFRHGAVGLLSGEGKVRGKGAVHRLREEGVEVGDLTVRGSRSFTRDERDHVKLVLGWFDFPFRNALRQQTLLRQASYDSLTGLLNRSTLSAVLEREVGLARRHQEIFSLIMLDIDHLKAINDEYGHAAGDSVLRQFSVILRQCTRRTDLLFRFAGDEFLLGSSHTNRAGAIATAERILAAVAAARFRHGRENLPPVRVSIGIADFQEEESAESLFERADGALLSAN